MTTAAAVALAATAATWLLAPKKMVSAPVEEIESADALVVDSREVGLGTGPERPHYLSPGLELRRKPKSPPVELITAYYDADGRVLATETETVKASRTSFAVIPAAAKDAAKAVFVVRRQKPGDAPCIVHFDPRAAVKRQ